MFNKRKVINKYRKATEKIILPNIRGEENIAAVEIKKNNKDGMIKSVALAVSIVLIVCIGILSSTLIKKNNTICIIAEAAETKDEIVLSKNNENKISGIIGDIEDIGKLPSGKKSYGLNFYITPLILKGTNVEKINISSNYGNVIYIKDEIDDKNKTGYCFGFDEDVLENPKLLLKYKNGFSASYDYKRGNDIEITNEEKSKITEYAFIWEPNSEFGAELIKAAKENNYSSLPESDFIIKVYYKDGKVEEEKIVISFDEKGNFYGIIK